MARIYSRMAELEAEFGPGPLVGSLSPTIPGESHQSNIPKGEPANDIVHLDDTGNHASIPTGDQAHSPLSVDQDNEVGVHCTEDALPSGIARPPSRQASARYTPGTHADHMSAIADQPEDDPDVSVFEIKPKAPKRKTTKGSKRARISSDSDETDKIPPYEPLQEIPYGFNVFNAMYLDTCSPDDWEANTLKWTLKTGTLTQAQAGHALAQMHSPIWAIKTADMAASTKPIIILAQSAWTKLVADINQREMEIHIAKHKGLRSKPKTMLPLLVVKTEEEVSPNKCSIFKTR
jgi:hypothetical protein